MRPPHPSHGADSPGDKEPIDGSLTCRWCAQEHRVVSLAPRERAICVRCGATLARGSRFGADVPLAAAVTGLVLAVPAMLLPIMTAAKLGNEHSAQLFSGVVALWHYGFPPIAVWVLICGTLVPVGLLVMLVALLLPMRLGRWSRPLASRPFAQQLAQWAMPEVQVLAVLVAFAKLGDLVTLNVGAGLWFYAAMALALVIAWRGFDLRLAAAIPPRGKDMP